MCKNIQNSVICTVSIHCVESVVVGNKRNNRNSQEKPLCKVEIMQKTLKMCLAKTLTGLCVPVQMCSKCNFTLKNLKRKACSSGKTKEKAKSLLEKSKLIWKTYNSSLSAQDCSVCSQFLHLNSLSRGDL